MARKRMREKDDVALKLLFIMLAVDNGSFLSVPYIKKVILDMHHKFGRKKIDKKFAEYHRLFKLNDEFRLTALAWGPIQIKYGNEQHPDETRDTDPTEHNNGLLKWENTTDPNHPDFDPKGGVCE